MLGLRKYLVWTGGGVSALALFIAGAFGALIVFDEADYWRTLLRQGDYGKLDKIISELERDTFNPYRLLSWGFSRNIHYRYPQFEKVRAGLVFSAIEKKAPAGKPCPQGNAEADGMLISTIQKNDAGGFAETAGKNLCEIEYRITNNNFGAYALLAVGSAPEKETEPFKAQFGKFSHLNAGKTKSLSIKFSGTGAPPRTYHLIAVAAQRQRMGPTEWIGAARTDAEIKDLIRRAARLGLAMVVASHTVGK